MQRDKASLLDAARSATLVLEFVSGMDKVTLAEDVKTQARLSCTKSLLWEKPSNVSRLNSSISILKFHGAKLEG